MALTTAGQIRLLVEVRWQIFANSLRSKMNQVGLVIRVITGLMAAAGALGAALAFFAGGYFAASRGREPLIGLMLVLIALLWQLAPVLLEVAAPKLNFKEIARYPVTFQAYYLLHLAYGLLDPSVVVGLVWLAAVWMGIAFARIAWAPRAFVLFTLFALFNVLLSRWILSLVERLLGSRRGREASFFLFFGLFLVFQFFVYGVAPRLRSSNTGAFMRTVAPFWRWSPAGLATGGLSAGLAGTVSAIALLAAYCGLAALLLGRRLRSNFSGETLSEGQSRAGAVQVEPGWQLPFLSNRISSIFEKEFRYAWRDKRTLTNLASPLVLVLLVVSSRGTFLQSFNQGLRINTGGGNGLSVVVSGMCVLFLSNLAYNCCGSDGYGFQRWALAPVRARDVLLGKNLTVATLSAAAFLLVNAALALAGTLPFSQFAIVALGVIYGELMLLSIGNQLSVRSPVMINLESITAKNVSEYAALGGFLFQACIAASIWLLAHESRVLAMPWVLPLGLAIFDVVAVMIYLASLDIAAGYMDRHIEKMSEQLRPV